jgi:hypothetical protein
MTDTLQKSTQKERVSTYVYFCSLYFVTVGALYLWGYWSTFNINILEYLSLADIIKTTVYPIASAFAFFVIGAALPLGTSIDSMLPQGGGSSTPEGKLFHRLLPYILFIYAIGIFALFYFGPIEKWLILPFLISTPASAYAMKRGVFQNVLQRDLSRLVAITILTTLPTFAYGHGRLLAQRIVDGIAFEYALSPIENVSVAAETSAAQRPRFLGHAGDFIFFLEPIKGTIVIAKFEAAKGLVLKRFERALQSHTVTPKPGVEGAGKSP